MSSVSVHLSQSFFEAAAREFEAQRLELGVEREVFEELTAPVKEFLENDAVYGEYETGVAFRLEMVLQMLQDAWVKEVNYDKSDERNNFRNALQGIMEDLLETRHDVVAIGNDSLFGIMRHRDAVNDAADIHERFMGNDAHARTLRAFSAEIVNVHQRQWTPSLEVSSNDEIYHQPKTA